MRLMLGPGAMTDKSYVDDFLYLGWDHNYYNLPNAYYWGDGRYDETIGGLRYVDGRPTFGWQVTGTYSIPIDANLEFFRYGGPGR